MCHIGIGMSFQPCIGMGKNLLTFTGSGKISYICIGIGVNIGWIYRYTTFNGISICNIGINLPHHYWYQLESSDMEPCSISIGINTSLAAKGALAHCLQRRTACKIQNGRHGAPKWPTGLGRVSTPRFLGVLSNFR